jgi:mannitol operon repressor
MTSKKSDAPRRQAVQQSYAEGKDEMWEKDPHFRGFSAMLKELNAETDRGAALVVTSFLDRLLGDALTAFLIENESTRALLVGFNAPLGTLSTKIAACHALGIITEGEMRQSNILRKVRNEFAHQIEVTFENGRVKDLCGNFSVPEKDQAANARGKFIKASMLLLIALINRPHNVAQKRLTCSDWGLGNQKEKAPGILPAS